MKIVFNCSVNVTGGAVQNAANFIRLSILDDANKFYYLLSKEVDEVLVDWGIILSKEQFLIVKHPLFNFREKKKIKQFVKDRSADLVYTMAGPSYVKFDVFHVLGISDPYISHASIDDFFYKRSIVIGGKHLIKTILKGIWSRFEGDYFIFQTEFSKKKYLKRYFLSERSANLVGNAIGGSFSHMVRKKISLDNKQQYTILCPSANYPHKDISILLRVMEIAEKKELFGGKKVRIIVTLPKESELSLSISKKINNSSVEIINHGPFLYTNAAKLYDDADIVLLPSILETFSTTYLEALYMGKPLIVPRKGFVYDICGESAIYYEPKNEEDLVKKILMITAGGVKILKDPIDIFERYGNYQYRYKKILEVIGSKVPRG